MKARMIRESKCRNPDFNYNEFSRCLQKGVPYKVDIDLIVKVGAIIDAPDCWRLVLCGIAEPADEECRIASGNLTDEEIQKRIDVQDKLSRGMLSNKPEQNARSDETLDENLSPEAMNA